MYSGFLWAPIRRLSADVAERPNDECPRVNPPLLAVFGSADVFPLTRTKGLCFCFQACPFLKGHRSQWSQGGAVIASLNIWRPSECDDNTLPARRLRRRLAITLKIYFPYGDVVESTQLTPWDWITELQWLLGAPRGEGRPQLDTQTCGQKERKSSPKWLRC